MFGEKALELIRELQRYTDGTLAPYNVRLVSSLFTVIDHREYV